MRDDCAGVGEPVVAEVAGRERNCPIKRWGEYMQKFYSKKKVLTVVCERRRRRAWSVICRCWVEGGDGYVLVVGMALLGAGGPIPIAVVVRDME